MPVSDGRTPPMTKVDDRISSFPRATRLISAEASATSATGNAVLGSILGFEPLFGFIAADFRFDHPLDFSWFVVPGIVATDTLMAIPLWMC